MAKTPSYIASLNALANAERGGQVLFERWAAKTKNADLRQVLETVAIREAEHSWAFEKRLDELGFPCKKAAPGKALGKLKRLMGSDASDEAKFEAFGIGVRRSGESGGDRLLALLADETIDPQTGALLGRFICEERDSGRILTRAYKALKRKKQRKKAA